MGERGITGRSEVMVLGPASLVLMSMSQIKLPEINPAKHGQREYL